MDATAEKGQTEKTQRASLSDSLAAERTYLAWIRTGLALLGLGFVVARFGLFLERLDYLEHVAPAHSYGLSVWFGTGLILAGVAVYLSSAWNYVRLIRALNRGEVVEARPSVQAVLVAVFLALVGLGMAIYLISVRGSARGGDAEAFEFRSRVLEASGQIRPRAAGMGPERPSAIAGGQRNRFPCRRCQTIRGRVVVTG